MFVMFVKFDKFNTGVECDKCKKNSFNEDGPKSASSSIAEIKLVRVKARLSMIDNPVAKQVCTYAKCASVQACCCADMFSFGYAGVQVCGCAGVQVCMHAGVEVCSYADMHLCICMYS